MNIKRGSIYLANLDPTIGGEIRKTRPVLVISNDVNNRYNSVVTILPLTSNTEKVFPFEVFLPKGMADLPKDSKAKADQIRTIDKGRLTKFIGMLPENKLEETAIAVKKHLDLS